MTKTYYLTSEDKRRYLATMMATIIVGLMGMYLILWFYDVIKQYPIVAILPLGFGVYQIINLVNYYDEKHIIVSEEGIIYNSPRVVFMAKWQDLERLSSGWHERIKQEGLIVDKLKLKTKNLFQQLLSKEFFLRKSSKAFIPLSCFATNWRDSKLGQQIKQYAPHLFEKENSI